MPSVGNSFNSFAFQAISSFSPKPKTASSEQSIEAFIRELRQRASGEDQQTAQDAIEVLFNFVAGLGEAPETSRLATQALMSIAGDSKAKPHVRAAIREMAFNIFEITAGKRFTSKADSKREVGSAGDVPASSTKHGLFSLPPELMALALRHAQACNYRATQSEIGDAMGEALGLDKPGCAQMKDPDRYTTFPEMFNGLGDLRDKNLPVQENLLGPGLSSFKEDFRNFALGALRSQQPQAVLLYHRGHFVAVVVGPSSQAGKLDVVVYDSLHGEGHEHAKFISQKIRGALDDELQELTYAGGDVQGTTNGCGPLCVRALSDLRACGASSMEHVAQRLEEDVANLRKFDYSARADLVAAWRARMLGGLQNNTEQYEAFKEQMKPEKLGEMPSA